MIEEIKKEIKNTFYIDEDNMHFEVAEININTLFKILDKHKDKEDKYKNAWEELKEDCKEIEKDNDTVLFSRLEQLEKNTE